MEKQELSHTLKALPYIKKKSKKDACFMDNNYYGSICYCRKCNGIVHTIKKGDTLYLLSRYYNVPIGEIMNANRNLNIYNLQIGQEICIPIRRRDMMNDTINGTPVPQNNMRTAPSAMQSQNDMLMETRPASPAADMPMSSQSLSPETEFPDKECSSCLVESSVPDSEILPSMRMSDLIADENMTFEKFMELVRNAK